MFSHKIDNSVIVCQLCIVIVCTIKLEAEALFDSLLFYDFTHRNIYNTSIDILIYY